MYSHEPAFEPTSVASTIERKRKKEGISIRNAADLANISEGRWRQIAKGFQQMGGGVKAPVNAPADTLSRMAIAVNFWGDNFAEAYGEGFESDPLAVEVSKLIRKALPEEAPEFPGEIGDSDYLQSLVDWVEGIQRRLKSLEVEVEELRAGRADSEPTFPDYSNMSEEDARNYGLAAKEEDEHIGFDEIPNQP